MHRVLGELKINKCHVLSLRMLECVIVCFLVRDKLPPPPPRPPCALQVTLNLHGGKFYYVLCTIARAGPRMPTFLCNSVEKKREEVLDIMASFNIRGMLFPMLCTGLTCCLGGLGVWVCGCVRTHMYTHMGRQLLDFCAPLYT